MKEYKITVIIAEDGSISSETKGFKGASCIDELESLFEDIAQFDFEENTKEFYEKDIIMKTVNKTKVGIK